jgi:hypothetical protein
MTRELVALVGVVLAFSSPRERVAGGFELKQIPHPPALELVASFDLQRAKFKETSPPGPAVRGNCAFCIGHGTVRPLPLLR